MTLQASHEIIGIVPTVEGEAAICLTKLEGTHH